MFGSSLILAVQLTSCVLSLVPDYVPRFRKLVPRLSKRLQAVSAGEKAECNVGSVADPFVQVQMLRLLQVLASDDANATTTVTDVVTSVESYTRSHVDHRANRNDLRGGRCSSLRVCTRTDVAGGVFVAYSRSNQHPRLLPPEQRPRHPLRVAFAALGNDLHQRGRGTAPADDHSQLSARERPLHPPSRVGVDHRAGAAEQRRGPRARAAAVPRSTGGETRRRSRRRETSARTWSARSCRWCSSSHRRPCGRSTRC